MRSTRSRAVVLVFPLALAVACVLIAIGISAGWVAQPRSDPSYLYAVLSLALLSLAASIGQIIWHARMAAIERNSRSAQIEESQKAMDSVSDGVIVYDHDWRFIYLNRSAALVAAKPRDALIGRTLWEMYPELVGGELHQRYLEAQRSFSQVSFEYFTEPTGQWLELRIFPAPQRITVVLRDVSDQHAALAQLEQANQSIAQQLKLSEEIAGSLRESNKQLGERNRQLQEFAHIASHDLQEPVRKIRIFGEMLREHSQALGGSGRDYLDRMLGASTRMQSLIASLLAFARVGANKPAQVPVDVQQVVNDVLADLIAESHIPHPRVLVGNLPKVVGDPVLLRQVMQNLLANAVKFVKPGERASIEINGEAFRPDGATADWCRITVKDSGIGFDPAESERVFDLFRRLHGRATYEGSGIGLAIVRRIIEHHGGRVRATGSPGIGATFEIEMPMTPASMAHPGEPMEGGQQ